MEVTVVKKENLMPTGESDVLRLIRMEGPKTIYTLDYNKLPQGTWSDEDKKMVKEELSDLDIFYVRLDN